MEKYPKKQFISRLRYWPALLILPFLLTGCGAPAEIKPSAPEPISVRAQSIKDSQTLKQELQFSAIISADKEAAIAARTSGTVKEASFKIGDQVKLGQILVRVDDVTSSDQGSSLSSSQVKQAMIAVEQAGTSYRLAQKNYNDLLLSSQKDLNQLSITKNQAITGNSNLSASTNEAIKSAEIALSAAKTSADLAKQNLDNKGLLSGQSESDVATNAETAISSALSTCDSIITGIDNLLDLDINDPKNISYKNNLGVLDSSSLRLAVGAYEKAQALNRSLKAGLGSDPKLNLDKALTLVNSVLGLANAGKDVTNNSVTSTILPQNTVVPGAPSLSGLQSAMSGYQTQITATLSQLNGAKQALANTSLGNQTATDSLKKAYQLAQAQVASAEQNLSNLKIANKSQLDQSKFGIESASNQLSGNQIKIQTQIAVAKSQADIAALSYQNAQVALQNAYDSHLLVTPINGTITQKNISVGDSVTAGQILLKVSEIASIKLSFYVDEDNLPYLSAGQKLTITPSDGSAIAGHITDISQSADAITKRFLVEAMPDKVDLKKFNLGSIASISLSITKKPQAANSILLPLSAIEIGQNANYIFTVKDGKAAKQSVEIIKVVGETAEIKTDLPKDALIVVENNKLLEDGSPVVIQK